MSPEPSSAGAVVSPPAPCVSLAAARIDMALVGGACALPVWAALSDAPTAAGVLALLAAAGTALVWGSLFSLGASASNQPQAPAGAPPGLRRGDVLIVDAASDDATLARQVRQACAHPTPFYLVPPQAVSGAASPPPWAGTVALDASLPDAEIAARVRVALACGSSVVRALPIVPLAAAAG